MHSASRAHFPRNHQLLQEHLPDSPLSDTVQGSEWAVFGGEEVCSEGERGVHQNETGYRVFLKIIAV